MTDELGSAWTKKEPMTLILIELFCPNHFTQLKKYSYMYPFVMYNWNQYNINVTFHLLPNASALSSLCFHNM